MKLLDAALDYARRGAPVFPCAARGKAPLTVHGFKDATTDLDVITRWWRLPPAPNIGLATGVVFDVLDLDNPEAIRWARSHGVPNSTPCVLTGRGLHMYFAPTGHGNRVNLAPGVDFKGVGGYVIAPPSVHSIGTHYRCIAGNLEYISEAPRWLCELLAEHNTGTSGAPSAVKPLRSNLTPGETQHLTASGVASLHAMAERLATTPAGNRNALLFWCACRAADTGITQSDVRIVLYDAAQRAGLTDHEIGRTLHSAFSRWQ